MKEGLLLFCAFLITFFMGFFLFLGAFPYIISYFAKKVRMAYEKGEDSDVFKWTVSFIVAFGCMMLLRECN